MSSAGSLEDWSDLHTNEIRARLPTYYCETIEDLKEEIGDKPSGRNEAREWSISALTWAIAQLKSGEMNIMKLRDQFKESDLPLDVSHYLLNDGNLSNSLKMNDFIFNCTTEQTNRLQLAAEIPALGQNPTLKKITPQQVLDYGARIWQGETIRDASRNVFPHHKEYDSSIGSHYLRKFKTGVPKRGRVLLGMEPKGHSTVHANMFNSLIAARSYLKQNPHTIWRDVNSYVNSIANESRSENYLKNLLDKKGDLRMTRNNRDNIEVVRFYNWLHHPTNEEKLQQWDRVGE